MRKATKYGPTLGQSFPVREVRALLELHACVMRGGDARQIASSREVSSVVRKFVVLRTKHENYIRGRANAVDDDGDDEHEVAS